MAMADAGVPLVAGTDAPTIPGLVPGFSLLEDIQVLIEAGLTPYQALSTATRETCRRSCFSIKSARSARGAAKIFRSLGTESPELASKSNSRQDRCW